MRRRAWMWVAFQLAHLTLSFTSWTLFLLGLYESDREGWTLIGWEPRWWAIPLLIAPSPILYVVGFRLRSGAPRPRLAGSRRWWRGALLTLWVFFSISVGAELFQPEGHVRLAIVYGGLAALSWWGAWRIARTHGLSAVAGRLADPPAA